MHTVDLSCLGTINGPIIGIIMREAVRRAMVAIRATRFNLKATAKATKADGGIDWVTNADAEAQKVYVKILRECFPIIGIVAEEDELRIECLIDGVTAYFTVDPLDGTAAAKRKQSHGIGSMLSLVINGVVVAVCIGDVLTGELYYFRPESDKTHRLDDRGLADQLHIDPEVLLAAQYLLLRNVPTHPMIQRIADVPTGPFKSYEITGGSIGISMARLWKSEVGGTILQAPKSTPWDSNPIMGMSKRLGFVFLTLGDHRIEQADWIPFDVTLEEDHPMLVIHRSRLPELQAWASEVEIPLNPLSSFGS